MKPDPKRIRELFVATVGKVDPERWETFLENECGGEPELLDEVRLLLDAHREAGSFLKSPAVDLAAIGDSRTSQAFEAHSPGAPALEIPGTAIGPYKLLQAIGEGGMGTVYMAEQTQPVRRTVALKLIKAGMDSRQILARFGAERQALALMDHPNIAKVFDAGTTDTGRPYFVMELVKGIPITTFCDERRLTLRERLELAIPVCQAVQHAHQKGIIHRDLKPSNVLIALYDGKPVPKVIDFGVAKATGPRLTEQTLYTEFGAVVGTLEYMSPEQAELNQLDIDTRSDIYSLGVLLYELLTGSTPLEHKRLKTVLFLEVLRLIREEESQRPSDRLSTTDELPSIAACRHVEPRKLSGLVRGELDWIVMKALEKDRNRRYETANSLAADLRRYLANEAVQACPPSVHYRLSKLARKHRAALATTAALALLLLLGAAVSAWQAVVATRANRATTKAHATTRLERDRAFKAEAMARDDRDRAIKAEGEATSSAKQARTEAAIARAVNDFLQKDLLAEPAPKQNARDRHVTVEAVLNRAAARIAGKFDDNPAVEAAIRQTVGDTYMELGLYPEGQPHMQRALELRRQVLGPEHSDTLMSMNNLAQLYDARGQYDKAEPLNTQVLEIKRRVLGPEHPDTLTSMNNLATLYHAQGQYEKAESLHTQVLEILRRVLGPEHPDTLTSMNNLATMYEAEGHYDKAEPLNTQVLEAKRRVLGPEHPETLSSMNNLALLYKDQGQHAKAELLFTQALEIQRRVLGSEHLFTLKTINNLAELYEERGQFAMAEPLFTQALEAARRVLGPNHPQTLIAMNSLARLYHDLGQNAKAAPLFTQVLEDRRRLLGPEHPDTLTSMNNLAATYHSLGQYAKAEPLFTQALEGKRRILGPEHPHTLGTMNHLAELYRARGQYDQAEPLLTEALEVERRSLGPEHPDTLLTMNNLALLYSARGHYEKAEPLFTQALAVQRRVLGSEHPDTLSLMNNLARLYEGRGQYEKAEPLFTQVLKDRRRVLGPEHPHTLASMTALASLYESQGRFEKGKPLVVDALRIQRRTLGADDPRTAGTMATLGLILLKQQEYAEAASILHECLTIREAKLPDDWSRYYTQNLLGGSLLGQRDFAKAEPLLLAGYTGMKTRETRIPARSKVLLAGAGERVVQLYEAWGNKEKAESWRAKITTTPELPANPFAP